MQKQENRLTKKANTLYKIKRLEAERERLVGPAKQMALQKAEEALRELADLGFDHQFVEK